MVVMRLTSCQMRRHLADLGAGLAALLCVAIAVVWVRSHRVGDLFMYDSFQNDGLPHVLTSFWVYVDSGGVGVIWSRLVCTADAPKEARDWFEGYCKEHRPGWSRQTHENRGYPKMTSGAPPAFDHFGLLVSREPWGGMGGQKYPCFRATVPMWLLAFFSCVPPLTLRHRRWRLRKLMRDGCCRVCGYDLRATPARCPECGTANGAGETAAV
jgi:hypothetical protein